MLFDIFDNITTNGLQIILDCSFPISLQFGLGGLEPFAPLEMNELQEIIKQSKENIRMQLDIRKSLEHNQELK